MKRLFLGALTVLLATALAWGEAKLSTAKTTYSFMENIAYSCEGLPPQTMIFIYSGYFDDGEPEVPAERLSMRHTITTGPRGIIEGEIDAPPSGNTGRSGTFIIELRPNNQAQGGTRIKLRIVPKSK